MAVRYRAPQQPEGLLSLIAQMGARESSPIAQGILQAGQSIGEGIGGRFDRQRLASENRDKLMTLLAEKGVLQPSSQEGGGIPLEQLYPGAGFKPGMAYKKKQDEDIVNPQEEKLWAELLETTPEKIRGSRISTLKAMAPQYYLDEKGNPIKVPKGAKPLPGGETASLKYQKEKDIEKKALELQELQIPGYKLGDNVRPTTVEAKGLRDSIGSMTSFSKGIDRMIGLIKEHGSTELTGEASGEMQALAAELKLTLKEVQKLGVLSATDTVFLEAQIFDPSQLKSVMTKAPTAIKQLETARDRAKSLLSETLKVKGYSPEKSGGLTDAQKKRLAELRAKKAENK